MHMGVLALLVYLCMSTGSGQRKCAYRRTRPLGGGGGIIFVAFWEFIGFHSNAPGVL